MKKGSASLDRIYPYILIIGGALGLWAAFTLSLEALGLLKDPAFVPSCNLSPIVSCGSVISSAQGSVFGFPNPYIGLMAFPAVIVVGMSLLAGAAFRRWYWRLFWLGTLGGFAFIHWLFFQSVYRLNVLCPYCVLVYIVTGPIFWYTTLYLLRNGHLLRAPGRFVTFMQNNHFSVLMLWYLGLIGLVLHHFWYYFQTIF